MDQFIQAAIALFDSPFVLFLIAVIVTAIIADCVYRS